MNRDQMMGKWEQFKGKVKERWGKLTDNDIKTIAGRRDQLSGRIQELYGLAKEDAEKQVKAFEAECEQESKRAFSDRPVPAHRE